MKKLYNFAQSYIFENLKKIPNFLGKCKLPKLTIVEIDNLNRSITKEKSLFKYIYILYIYIYIYIYICMLYIF